MNQGEGKGDLKNLVVSHKKLSQQTGAMAGHSHLKLSPLFSWHSEGIWYVTEQTISYASDHI